MTRLAWQNVPRLVSGLIGLRHSNLDRYDIDIVVYASNRDQSTSNPYILTVHP